jgi:hypothetical protein
MKWNLSLNCNLAVSHNIRSLNLIILGPPNEVERLSKEGQRGGHAEDGHAQSAGRSQDRPRPARKGLGRHEGDQDKVCYIS